MRGRMGRYALWQVRDFMMGRGAAFVIIAVLLGVTSYLGLKSNGDAWKLSPAAAMMSRQALAGPINFLSFIGIVIACNALVSADRAQGYFRFLFAKPVHLVQYYSQLWLLHGVCVLALAAVLTWLWGVFEVPVPIARVVAMFAIAYVLIGGVTFVLSTIMRYDWLITIMLWTLAQLIAAPFMLAGRPNVKAVISAILPPQEHYAAVQKALASATGEIPTADLVWVLGYGVACVVVGLVILRKRPMAA